MLQTFDPRDPRGIRHMRCGMGGISLLAANCGANTRALDEDSSRSHPAVRSLEPKTSLSPAGTVTCTPFPHKGRV